MPCLCTSGRSARGADRRAENRRMLLCPRHGLVRLRSACPQHTWTSALAHKRINNGLVSSTVVRAHVNSRNAEQYNTPPLQMQDMRGIYSTNVLLIRLTNRHRRHLLPIVRARTHTHARMHIHAHSSARGHARSWKTTSGSPNTLPTLKRSRHHSDFFFQ